MRLLNLKYILLADAGSFSNVFQDFDLVILRIWFHLFDARVAYFTFFCSQISITARILKDEFTLWKQCVLYKLNIIYEFISTKALFDVTFWLRNNFNSFLRVWDEVLSKLYSWNNFWKILLCFFVFISIVILLFRAPTLLNFPSRYAKYFPTFSTDSSAVNTDLFAFP